MAAAEDKDAEDAEDAAGKKIWQEGGFHRAKIVGKLERARFWATVVQFLPHLYHPYGWVDAIWSGGQ